MLSSSSRIVIACVTLSRPFYCCLLHYLLFPVYVDLTIARTDPSTLLIALRRSEVWEDEGSREDGVRHRSLRFHRLVARQASPPPRLHRQGFRQRSRRLSMACEGKVVCVTGATGFIASWLVKLLLRRGYTVEATVRDPDDPRKTGHLRSLEGAAERLHLFRADLVEEGSFDAAIYGCDGVFHTASPVLLGEVNDPQADLLDPAVKGTLNVLNSCSKTSTVKRVIVTSSIVAVLFNGEPLRSGVMADETWFSDPDFCKQIKAWYMLSKTLAEKAAWKFAKEHSLDLVTINPGLVIGPLLQPTLNLSNEAILKIISGDSTYPNLQFGWVGIRNVCEAHILAYEIPSASGRYCLVERVIPYTDIIKHINQIYPSILLPQKAEDDDPVEQMAQVSREKAKGLGINFTPFVDCLKETLESLKEKGFVSF